MSWLTKTLTSSIGKKVLMSLTGLFLCTFLIVHLIGNFQLFKSDGGYAFNTYAVFMTSNPLIKTVSYVLYFLILFHAVWGIYLEFQNRKARPSRYAVVKSSAPWASRNMATLGLVLFVYIAVHMANFWYEYKFGHVPYKQYVENMLTNEVENQQELTAEDSKMIKAKKVEVIQGVQKIVVVKDLYKEVAAGFKNPLISIFYVIAMIALGLHLTHGFQSAFQTLGINHPKYAGFIKNTGILIFGILIPLAFAAMPIFFLIK